MEIKSLQSVYIQKSRIFLYPLLGIRRGVSVTPINTYMTWDKMYTVNDYKFIAVYHIRDDKDFKLFEETALMDNPLFEDFFELEDGNRAYVFDYGGMRIDYKKIVNGKYSLLSGGYKHRILSFFKNHHRHHQYILSYFNPKKYINEYAKLLGVKVSLLKGVGELCSLPDLDKEALKIPTKVPNFDPINNL